MASFLDHPETRQLKQTIDWHLANIKDDAELKMRLEGVATQPRFRGLTWYWAPRLYARNRAAFRSFIQQHWSEVGVVPDGKFTREEPVVWAGEPARELEPWFQEVDRANDVVLFRRLYQWRHRGERGWGIDAERWRADLVARFAAAGTPAQRSLVLDKLDLREQLDEAAALSLYRTDPVLASPFILKHLPGRSWRDRGDTCWHALMQCAQERGDRDLHFKLYRRLVPLDRWRDEALGLAPRVCSPARCARAIASCAT